LRFVSPDKVVTRSLFIELARFLTPLQRAGKTIPSDNEEHSIRSAPKEELQRRAAKTVSEHFG
jgi:hypothetical protein